MGYGYNESQDAIFYFWAFVAMIVGVVIWFFLVRASVKANQKIELLSSIDKKLSLLLDGERPTKLNSTAASENSPAQMDAKYFYTITESGYALKYSEIRDLVQGLKQGSPELSTDDLRRKYESYISEVVKYIPDDIVDEFKRTYHASF